MAKADTNATAILPSQPRFLPARTSAIAWNSPPGCPPAGSPSRSAWARLPTSRRSPSRGHPGRRDRSAGDHPGDTDRRKRRARARPGPRAARGGVHRSARTLPGRAPRGVRGFGRPRPTSLVLTSKNPFYRVFQSGTTAPERDVDGRPVSMLQRAGS
jgi:hypothetical protein